MTTMNMHVMMTMVITMRKIMLNMAMTPDANDQFLRSKTTENASTLTPQKANRMMRLET